MTGSDRAVGGSGRREAAMDTHTQRTGFGSAPEPAAGPDHGRPGHDGQAGVAGHEHATHGGGDEHGGHGGHGDHAALFRDRFWLTLILTIPVVIWSHHVQMWAGYTAPQFPGADAIGPVLGSVIFFYGGWPFLSGGWH
jgi:P-type Cu2+ transporter